MAEYTFIPFPYLSNTGFDYPIDVKYGTIYLGTLLTSPDGFVIHTVDTPNGKQVIKPTGNNKFKTQNIAAQVLHKTWKMYRHGGESQGSYANN